MRKNRFERWLESIHNTQEEEISCSECFDLVSRFVEVELSGKDAAAKMPQVKQHLEQCPACHVEYETLRDLQRLENDNELPSVDDLQDLIP
jgi:anti-sigma factor RsiW